VLPDGHAAAYAGYGSVLNNVRLDPGRFHPQAESSQMGIPPKNVATGSWFSGVDDALCEPRHEFLAAGVIRAGKL
jgi:hypothetical protein